MKVISFYMSPVALISIFMLSALAYLGPNVNEKASLLTHIALAVAILIDCFRVYPAEEGE